MGLQSSPVLLLHLRRLDRFLKRQGLHSAARTWRGSLYSLVYFDAAHLQRLVRSGRWEAAGTYLRRFSPLWEGEDGTNQQYTSFLHTVQHHAMLHYLACRSEEGGRDASSLFCNSNDAAFRSKFPEIAQRHDLYRSTASKQTRASVNWEAIKLATLENLLRGSQRHQRKRVGSKPARELALSFQQRRLSTSQVTGHSGESGRKRLRSQDDYCNGIAQKPFDPTKCLKKPRMAGDVGEIGEISV
ncbi:unnamed protein product [Urochloa decumbens]|uniref:Uncharacterized protein n=1 Tax=Urochloa decumbens TaxID=240449 RepID=A0ABC9AIB1_9POAL